MSYSTYLPPFESVNLGLRDFFDSPFNSGIEEEQFQPPFQTVVTATPPFLGDEEKREETNHLSASFFVDEEVEENEFDEYFLNSGADQCVGKKRKRIELGDDSRTLKKTKVEGAQKRVFAQTPSDSPIDKRREGAVFQHKQANGSYFARLIDETKRGNEVEINKIINIVISVESKFLKDFSKKGNRVIKDLVGVLTLKRKGEFNEINKESMNISGIFDKDFKRGK